MRTIQSQLPNPRHVEVNRIFVKSSPDAAWQAARHFDASTIPWIRLLFDVRSVPDLVRGRVPDREDRRLGVDQVAESGEGFTVVHETPGGEVVGKFWHTNIPFAELMPEEFRAFDKPGWGKLAWAIAVEPFREGSTISFELRTTATDEESWRALNRYYTYVRGHLETPRRKEKEHDDMLLRLLIAMVLLAHGVGHPLFLANSWGYWRGGEAGRSWLFSGLLGAGRVVEGIFGLLWLVAAAGAGLSGDLFSDDRPLVGRHQYLERLFRPCGRYRRHRGRAPAKTLGGSAAGGGVGEEVRRKS